MIGKEIALQFYPIFWNDQKTGIDHLCAVLHCPRLLIEHQDKRYDVYNGVVDQYYISLHSEDKTNIFGPSIAYQINDTFSIGLGLFYSYRIYRHEQAQFLVLANGNADALYSSIQIEEYSYLTKLGIQFSPFSPVFVGITLSKGTLSSKNVTSDSAKIETPSFSMSNLSYTEQKEYPTQLSVGMAIYPSPNLLVSLDFDYYDTSETGQQNTLNYSVGTEWFLNANHAFRFGYFTNNDNRKPCSTESCYGAKIDMTGFTLGYSSYSRISSFTLGVVSSTGSGKADIYGDRSNIVEVDRQSLTIIFAASYDY